MKPHTLKGTNMNTNYKTETDASVNERVDFIRKTYITLCMALIAFIGIETFLWMSGLAEKITVLIQNRFGLSLLLSVVWLVSYCFVLKWSSDGKSEIKALFGVMIWVVVDAFYLIDRIYETSNNGKNPETIIQAGIVTVIVFSGLSVFAFVSKKDFSVSKEEIKSLAWKWLGCFLLIAVIFGLDFAYHSTIGIAFMYIVVEISTFKIYRTGFHNAASLHLFFSIHILFLYILKICSNFSFLLFL
jgi:FtsH-binding integral membrane protein